MVERMHVEQHHPDHYSRMIPVAFRQCSHVVHVSRVVVEQTVLVHHNHADTVVYIEQSRIWRVVRGAPPIATHRTRGLRTEEIDPRRNGHADHCKVSVVTEAANLDNAPDKRSAPDKHIANSAPD